LVGVREGPQNTKCSNQRFRKAICSLSVRGPLVLICWFRYATQFVHSVLEHRLKGNSGSLKAEGQDDEMSKPVIITTSRRVGVIGPWANKKQFKASD
jgi:hypothetical protein